MASWIGADVMDDTARLDIAAQAIWGADDLGPAVWDMTPATRARYLRMAQCAIAALYLTQEQRTLADGMGGLMTDSKTGEATVLSRPCTRQSRLVSPWVKVEHE